MTDKFDIKFIDLFRQMNDRVERVGYKMTLPDTLYEQLKMLLSEQNKRIQELEEKLREGVK